MSNKPLRAGIVGLGGRGTGNMTVLLGMEDVTVTAVCDLYTDRMENGARIVEEKKGTQPFMSTNYRDVLQRSDVDVVFVFTSWEVHIEVAIASMKAGKPAAIEVGGAYSVNECWRLVNTFEETKVPCMLLENACYVRLEMMLLNMVQQGFFGELVHMEGGYKHDLRDEVSRGAENRHGRLRNYLNRNCDNYPTHDLGPIAQMLNLNRGNRMISLVSVASKSRGVNTYAQREGGSIGHLSHVPFAMGDVITTIIKCAHGETIVLSLDTTLPRAYSRGLCLHGTKAAFLEDNKSLFVDGVHNEKYHFSFHPWHEQWNNIENYREQYEHPVWRNFRPDPNESDNTHGGTDYLVMRAFVDSVLNNEPMPIDVYDMASWMSTSFSGSREAVASSSSTMGAFLSRERAMDMRWRSPPDRVFPFSPIRV